MADSGSTSNSGAQNFSIDDLLKMPVKRPGKKFNEQIDGIVKFVAESLYSKHRHLLRDVIADFPDGPIQVYFIVNDESDMRTLQLRDEAMKSFESNKVPADKYHMTVSSKYPAIYDFRRVIFASRYVRD